MEKIDAPCQENNLEYICFSFSSSFLFNFFTLSISSLISARYKAIVSHLWELLSIAVCSLFRYLICASPIIKNGKLADKKKVYVYIYILSQV